ncbi:MAG: hypothetical protein ACXW2T_10310 [Allosphingosinicella sp.]
MERHLPQSRPADVAGMIEHRLEIQTLASGLCDKISANGALHRRQFAIAADPAVADIIEELESLHHLAF